MVASIVVIAGATAGAACLLLGLFLVRQAIPFYVVKGIHSCVAFWIKIFCLNKKKSWQPRTDVTVIVESDVKSGFSTPSAKHFAIENLFSLLQSDKITLKEWRKNTDNPLFGYVKGGKCKISPRKIVKDDIEVEIIEAASNKSMKNPNITVIVYIHGGGYCGGKARNFIGFAGKVSKMTSTKVVAVDYDLAPERTLQHQIRQCSAVVEEFKQNGNKLIMIGDSAGAGLCVGTIQYLVAEGLNDLVPDAAVLIAPYVDVEGSGESHQLNVKSDKILSPSRLGLCRDCATPSDLVASDPRVSFVNGSFENFPPLYISVSQTEMLYSDAMSVCTKVRENGGEVTFEAMPYGIHDFVLFWDLVPEYKQTFKRICDFINQNIKN